MDKQSYRKELKRIKAKMYPDYKLDRVGFGFKTTDKRVPWLLFRSVNSNPDTEKYKQFLIRG